MLTSLLHLLTPSHPTRVLLLRSSLGPRHAHVRHPVRASEAGARAALLPAGGWRVKWSLGGLEWRFSFCMFLFVFLFFWWFLLILGLSAFLTRSQQCWWLLLVFPGFLSKAVTLKAVLLSKKTQQSLPLRRSWCPKRTCIITSRWSETATSIPEYAPNVTREETWEPLSKACKVFDRYRWL